MLRLLADENIEIKIVRGLLRRKPDLDIVRVQEVGLSKIFEIRRFSTVGQVIEAILLIAERSFENEWENQVIYIP
jgi:hypothetical protein